MMRSEKSLFRRALDPINYVFLRLSSIITDCLSPTTSLLPTSVDSNTGNTAAVRREEDSVEETQGSHFGCVTIEALPDEVLLEIFSFVLNGLDRDYRWRTLVHVCQRWRTVAFASPRRLDLRVLCTEKKPVREMLDIWPALPISIYSVEDDSSLMKGADNIIAALEHNDRVCQIVLPDLSSRRLESFTPAMQEPFPVLMNLMIGSSDETIPVIPDSFLGGFAPHLRYLHLHSIQFPALPKLLLSATDLVDLHLWRVPHSGSGYISPEAMATCMSALTRLEVFSLDFLFPPSVPDPIDRRPPLPTRTLLPALTELSFQGASEYLDDLVSRIDAPLLYYINLTFYNQPNFDTTQLVRFLSHTKRLSAFNRANLMISQLDGDIVFFPQSGPPDSLRVVLSLSFYEQEWQLSSLARFYSSFLSPLSALEPIFLEVNAHRSSDDMEDPTQWLELLHPFIAVKNLYLDAKVVPRVARALQELVGERVTEVLPSLQNIFLKPQQPKSSRPIPQVIPAAIEQFAAERQLAGHPVAVHDGEESG